MRTLPEGDQRPLAVILTGQVQTTTIKIQICENRTPTGKPIYVKVGASRTFNDASNRRSWLRDCCDEWRESPQLRRVIEHVRHPAAVRQAVWKTWMRAAQLLVLWYSAL